MTAHKQDQNEVHDQVEDTLQEQLENSHKDEAKLEDAHKGEEKLESPEKNADSLEAQLENAQAKASENWDQFIRAKAEMDNLRRRNVKDLESAHKFGIEKFVNELLPVIDSMALGLAVEDASAESLREGMELTMSMLGKMMEKLDIEEIDPLNEKFDAARHQAVTMQPSAEVEPNTVLAVMQKGYSLNERLIRPAMVIVSRADE